MLSNFLNQKKCSINWSKTKTFKNLLNKNGCKKKHTATYSYGSIKKWIRNPLTSIGITFKLNQF